MSRDIKKQLEEWQELNEEAKSIRPGVTWVGQPKYSIEEMYALRALKGKDPECDFSIVPGARRSDVTVGKAGNPIPTSGEGKMPTSEEDWDLWYKLNEGIQTTSPIGLLVEKEKTVISEGYLVTRLAELEQGIDQTASKLGVTFDPKTGEVQIDPTFQREPGEEVAPEIEDLAADLGMKKAPAPVAKPVNKSVSKDVEVDGEIPLAASVSRTTVIEEKEPEEIEEDEFTPTEKVSKQVATTKVQHRDVEDDEFGEVGVASDAEETATSTDGSDPSQGREEKEEGHDGPPSIRDLANEVIRRPALLREINGMKEELLDRDVKAKKVLAARRDLEVAKDAMDMDAAIYAAQKYRMQMEIATMKIALLRAVEQGRPHEVDGLKRGIADVYARMAKLENDFNIRAQGHQVDLGGAITNLEDAQKTLAITREESGIKRKHLMYSEEGLLKGMGVDVDSSGRTVNELELYDERGIMVDDVADVLSKATSYNIEGTVVIRKTSIEPDNDTSDAYYVGGSTMPALDVTTDGKDVEVSEAEVANRGIEHGNAIEPPKKSASDPDFDVSRDLGRRALAGTTAMYAVVGCQAIKNATQLANLTPEMLQMLSSAALSPTSRTILDSMRKGLYGKDTGVGFDEWLEGLGEDMKKTLEQIFVDKSLNQEKDMDDFGEITPPPEANQNGNNY